MTSDLGAVFSVFGHPAVRAAQPGGRGGCHRRHGNPFGTPLAEVLLTPVAAQHVPQPGPRAGHHGNAARISVFGRKKQMRYYG